LIQISSDEALVKWQVANSNVERLDKTNIALTEQIATLEQNIEDWNGAKILLELLKNYKLEKRKDFILGIINQALKDIFESNYRLDIQPRDNKGKSASSTQKYDIIFYQNDIEIARNDNLLTSNGGGVLSIASLFFKILIGYLYSKNKFYIFDEALSQVSPQYRGRLSRFLKEFCEQYSFTLVIVSQTEELEEFADIVYEVDSSLDSNNIPVLDIVDIQGEMPEKNFFYSRIKNFQSIVDQKFIFKGFTIIRGPNNSGKSASLRAVEALLFNNFKTDTYPRKNPGGGKLTTEVSFGYVGEEPQTPKEIGMKFKSGKVMFVIEGEEYFGKSLAGEKLKEAVEKIGFRYIDVKSMYKNFKGPLKDQTERIAYTNQYDGLFLIGSKTSDSEKIFSFLFNTENIALAIQQSKEAMLEFNKEHKDAQIQLDVLLDELKEAKLNVDYFLKLYYYMIMQEYANCINTKFDLDIKRITLVKMEEISQNYISAVDNTIWLTDYNSSINSLQNKALSNNTQIGLIENIQSVIHGANLIQGFQDLENTRQQYIQRIETIDQLTPRLQGLLNFSYFTELLSNIKYYQSQADVFSKYKKDLDKEYNLCECGTCQGIGVIPGLN